MNEDLDLADRGQLIVLGINPTANVQALIQLLVSQVIENKNLVPSDVDANDEPNILLEYTVDGLRYMLVCARPIELPAARTQISPREREIGRMVAKGYPNKTIAAVLEISPWTVSTHLRRMFAKLGVNSRAALVEKLHQEGLLLAC